MSGICIAKFKNEKMPSETIINNCLSYTKSFGFAYNKNNKIFIHRNILQFEQYNKIIEKENINEGNAIIYKFSCYYNDEQTYQPLILCDNYNSIKNKTITNKSVAVFYENIQGFETYDSISSQMQFCKIASKFNRYNHSQLFELALGDNLSAILNKNGQIELYGLNRNDKWQLDNGIYYSNSDYKTIIKQNQYYNSNNYYDRYYSSLNYTDSLVCDICFKKVNSLYIEQQKMVCSQCKKCIR